MAEAGKLESRLKADVATIPGPSRVVVHGLLPRGAYAKLLSECDVGLVAVKPEKRASQSALTLKQAEAARILDKLPAGSRLFVWPERPLPEVVTSLQVRPNEGLLLLWHSRLENNFDTDPPRETIVSPMVTTLAYDYFEPDFNRWTTESRLKMDQQGSPMAPQRLRLTFAYEKMTRESVITLPTPREGLPMF